MLTLLTLPSLPSLDIMCTQRGLLHTQSTFIHIYCCKVELTHRR